MLIIGNKDCATLIAEITISEIQKVFDNCANGPKLTPKVGDVYDLGAGYNFRSSISDVCRNMTDTYRSFKRAHDTLLKFADMVTEQGDNEELRTCQECLDIANNNYDKLLAKHNEVLVKLGTLQLACKNLIQPCSGSEFQMYLDQIKELLQ